MTVRAIRCLVWCLGLGCSVPAIAGHAADAPGMLAYEDFDHAGSAAQGLEGGCGWRGPWVVESGSPRLIPAHELPDALAGFGGCISLGGNTRISRVLEVGSQGPFARAGLVDGGRVGVAGTVIYIGFQQRIGPVPGAAGSQQHVRYYALEFKRAGGDEQRLLDIGHDDRSHPGECYGAASVVNNGRTDLEPGQFRSLGREDAERNVIVVKIQFGPPGQDTALIFRNPAADESESVATARLHGDFRFDRIALARFAGNEPIHQIDEIRLATRWADALPRPEERKRQAAQAVARGRLEQALASARRQIDALAQKGADVGELRLRLDRIAAGGPATLDSQRKAVESLGAELALAGLGRKLDRLLFVKRHAFQPSHIYTEYSDGPYRPGGGLYLLSSVRPDGRVRCLFDARGGICRDPDLSADGRRVLFSYRPSAEGFYHVYEIGIDGDGLRQLTDGPYHDLDPFYLADGRIGLTSTRARSRALCFWVQAATLFVMDADGGRLRPLTANNVNEFTPAMLPDGRILFTRWEYLDKSAIFVQSLWTILPDGTRAQQVFGNNLIHPVSMLQARPIPGGRKVACTLAAHNGNSYGPLAVIDPALGVDNPAAILNLAPEVNYGRGCFAPYPLDERWSLVSYGPDEPLAIWLFDLAPSRESIRPGKKEYPRSAPQFPSDLGSWWASATSPRHLLYRDPVYSCVEAIPVVTSPRPPLVASCLPPSADAPPASGTTGTLLLVDVNRGLGGAVPRGRIKHLRVVEEMGHRDRQGERDYGGGVTEGHFHRCFPGGFMRLYAAPWEDGRPAPSLQAKHVYGTVPVEADGSAHFLVPAQRPIYFQALDERYNEVQRMRSYIHLQPGETLSCIGCHEARDSAPPVAATPVIAALRAPSAIQPPSFGAGPFDYQRLVQPIWDRRCGPCHSGPQPAGGVDLCGRRDARGVPASFATLVRPRTRPSRPPLVHFFDSWWEVSWTVPVARPLSFGAAASRLVEVIDQGHAGVTMTAAQRQAMGLTAQERHAVTAWIDLNCPLWDNYSPELHAAAR